VDEEKDRIWKGRKVLIVDDSAAVRKRLITLYQSLGFATETSCHGIEALEKLQDIYFDLVSLDIIMPGMHGLECYDLAKEKLPEQKFIFLSFLSKETSIIKAFKDRLPEEVFISKDIDQNSLNNTLNKILKTSKNKQNT